MAKRKPQVTDSYDTPPVLLVRSHEENQWQTNVQNEAEYLARWYTGWAKVAISRNAQAVAKATWRVYKRSDAAPTKTKKKNLRKMMARAGHRTKTLLTNMANVEEVTDYNDPLVSLLREAWPGGNTFELFEATESYVSIAGNAYWLKVYADGVVKELWPIAPQWVRPVPRKDSEVGIGSYVVGRGRENERVKSPAEMVHFKDFNPNGNPYNGMGDLSACLPEVQASVEISQHGLASLRNGAQPGLIWQYNKPVDDKKIEQARNAMDGKYAGTAKAGRNLVVGPDITITPWNAQQKELSYLLSDDSLRDKIGNVFGQSRAMMTSDSAALATAKEAIPTWQKMTIEPKCQRICDAINQQLVEKDFPGYVVMFDDVVDRDSQQQVTLSVAAAGGPVKTINEARAELGDEPIDGGDELRSPANPMASVFAMPSGDAVKVERAYIMSPEVADRVSGIVEKVSSGAIPKEAGLALVELLGVPDDKASAIIESAALPKPVAVATSSEPSPQGDDVSAQAEPVKEPAKVDEVVQADKPSESDKPAEPEPIQAKSLKAWLESDSCACGHVHKSADEVTYTEAQLAKLLDNFYRGLSSFAIQSIQDGQPVNFAGDDSFVEALASQVAPILETSARSGFASATELGTLGKFDAESFKTYSIKLADEVMNTYSDRINATIQNSLATNASIAETTQAIQAMLGTTQQHAALIAQTESTRANAMGREEAWKQTEGVIAKEWQLSGNPCPVCRALDGKVVPLGEPFWKVGETIAGVTNDYKDVENNPAHPNCGCVVIPVRAD